MYSTLSAIVAPNIAPTIGPNTYTHQPWNATVFQPAKYATIRGPKSLAGLNPACVNGANTAINAPTVIPINGGIKIPPPPLLLSFVILFFEFVNANITNASTPVPTASAKNAVPVEIGELKTVQSRKENVRSWRKREEEEGK